MLWPDAKLSKCILRITLHVPHGEKLWFSWIWNFGHEQLTSSFSAARTCHYRSINSDLTRLVPLATHWSCQNKQQKLQKSITFLFVLWHSFLKEIIQMWIDPDTQWQCHQKFTRVKTSKENCDCGVIWMVQSLWSAKESWQVNVY